MTPSKKPSLVVSILPVILLISLLIVNVLIFKDDATGGANQLALLFAGFFTILLGHFHLKVPYKKIEDQIVSSIKMALQSCLILLVVGALIGNWIQSGVVPTMIYWGLKIIHPAIFLPVSCITCSVVSLATGSSWSTSGTVGIALIGIGQTLGIPLPMVAGAVISGAYFGDKMSPLSDTTNLAPSMAGTDLITHIRHMVFTSGPAWTLAVIGFFILGFFQEGTQASVTQLDQTLSAMEVNFNISLWLLLVPLTVIILVAKKVSALPALIIGVFVSMLATVLLQYDLLVKMAGSNSVADIYKQLITVSYGGFSIESGDKLIDSLFNRGGMSNMLSTVWLIMMAMVFGGALEGCGMLQKMAASILSLVSGTASLVAATVGSCLLVNLTASDQYLAIVVPGRMFRNAFEEFGLQAKNLSRALEDGGTVTSVLIPWNSGGAYHAGILGVATLAYAPFCFFNIFSPIISIIVAKMDWTMDRSK